MRRATKPTILVQLDTDPQPSVFDGVVAVDAGVDHLFRHGGVRPESVRDLVHGALFTRGPADLHRTALFVGGSDVAAGEAVLKAVTRDASSPASASRSCSTPTAPTPRPPRPSWRPWKGSGGVARRRPAPPSWAATGPVGQRVARLLARLGATVAVGSRDLDRARATAEALQQATGRPFTPVRHDGRADELARGLADVSVVVAAGAAGVAPAPGVGPPRAARAEGRHRPQCRPPAGDRRGRGDRPRRRSRRRPRLGGARGRRRPR